MLGPKASAILERTLGCMLTIKPCDAAATGLRRDFDAGISPTDRHRRRPCRARRDQIMTSRNAQTVSNTPWAVGTANFWNNW